MHSVFIQVLHYVLCLSHHLRSAKAQLKQGIAVSVSIYLWDTAPSSPAIDNSLVFVWWLLSCNFHFAACLLLIAVCDCYPQCVIAIDKSDAVLQRQGHQGGYGIPPCNVHHNDHRPRRHGTCTWEGGSAQWRRQGCHAGERSIQRLIIIFILHRLVYSHFDMSLFHFSAQCCC